MKKAFLFLTFIVFSGASMQAQIDQNFGKAVAVDALNNSKDIVVGGGSAFIYIKGNDLRNSSGPYPVNYNYFIGSSSYNGLEHYPRFYTVLEFTVGKMQASMPGHTGTELTLLNASSFNAYYMTAEVAWGYQLMAKDAFYIGLETGPYLDLLAKMELKGNGMTTENYLHQDDYRSFNWGWSGGVTAGFRSLFANLSLGTTMKDYSKVDGISMTIPFQVRLSLGLRLTSKYGKEDSERIKNLLGYDG